MARIARIILPGQPHHVIQRGNRRQDVFFKDSDRNEYLRLLKEQSLKYGLKIWSYCLMSNHIHLIVVPRDKNSLAQAVGETHRRYTRMINFRERWRGYLWQGRCQSFPLHYSYAFACICYVERNPVRAKIVKKAEDYQWSSARVHVLKKKDKLLSHFRLLDEIKDWSSYLKNVDEDEKLELFRKHVETGRLLGDEEYIKEWEGRLNRVLHKQKPGPKPKVLN